MRNIVYLLIIAGLTGTIGGCQSIRQFATIDTRVNKLEQQVNEIQSEMYRLKRTGQERDSALRSDYASLKADLAAVRSDIQSLRGELEINTHRLEQHIQKCQQYRENQETKSKSLSKNLSGRISRLERYLGVEKPSGQKGRKKEGAPEKEDAPVVSADALYKVARQLFDAGDYAAARRSFKKLLANHPDSEKCDNARFWIGESYYRNEAYEKAILEYQKVIKQYPEGNKVPAALLKQGLAFMQIDDEINARLVLKKLVRKYPDSSEGGVARKKLKAL